MATTHNTRPLLPHPWKSSSSLLSLLTLASLHLHPSLINRPFLPVRAQILNVPIVKPFIPTPRNQQPFFSFNHSLCGVGSGDAAINGVWTAASRRSLIFELWYPAPLWPGAQCCCRANVRLFPLASYHMRQIYCMCTTSQSSQRSEHPVVSSQPSDLTLQSICTKIGDSKM